MPALPRLHRRRCRAREGAKSICVVEKNSDILPFERSSVHKGLYFVLGGVISPLDGIGPEALHLPQLVERIKAENIEELVLALGSSPEADSTALMIDRMLAGVNVAHSKGEFPYEYKRKSRPPGPC